ncbi:MAG: CocE/NonD family hydrolase [bacterium]
MRGKKWIDGWVIFLFFTLTAGSQDRAESIRTNYTKYEYRIPMRDGVKLFTAAYIPNDRSKTHPFLLTRTPYSVAPYGADRYREYLGPRGMEEEGYIFVFQDVRGRYMSEGEFVHMRPHNDNKNSNQDIDESTDTYDTIDWLLNHVANHNGKVGQWGISYPGFYSSAGAIDSHPALKAVSPQAPVADWFWDDFHFHGAFALSPAYGFFSVNGIEHKERIQKTPEPIAKIESADMFQFFLDLGPLKNVNGKYFKGEIDFWNQFVNHPNYDAFWKARNILPHLKNIRAAVLVVGGWFDTEDFYGPLKTYEAIERQNPGTSNRLVVGPWFHGGWTGEGRALGDLDFGFQTGEYYIENVFVKFMNHYLKDGDDDLDLPEAFLFETGANRWRTFGAWPPAERETRNLFLHGRGALSFEKPADPDTEFDAYVSDPAKPVPHSGKILTSWAKRYRAQEFFGEDQRFAASRPDVLVFKTDPLTEDITFAGPLRANLFVSTTGTDSDWVVKLIDVIPYDDPEKGGQQSLVRAQVFRGRYRNSYEFPEPFQPGEITEVSFEMPDILHTFQSGHRIMVQVQSTWFPFIDRNPQKYVPNIFEASEDDFIPVTNRIYHTADQASHIQVGILN